MEDFRSEVKEVIQLQTGVIGRSFGDELEGKLRGEVSWLQ